MRVGANYTAKIVCSNVFLAGRDPDEVLRTDVQAPGIALLRLMQVSVDRQQRVVRAGLLGFIGDGLALARPGTGCAAIPDGNWISQSMSIKSPCRAKVPLPRRLRPRLPRSRRRTPPR